MAHAGSRLAARGGAPGRAHRVGVREGGRRRRSGEPLAELVLSAELKGGDDSGEVLVSALAAEARATLSRLDAQKDRLRTDTNRVRAQLEALRGELDETARQLALQEARAELARAQLERAETMARQGFLSQGDFEQRRSEALAFELALSDARSRAGCSIRCTPRHAGRSTWGAAAGCRSFWRRRRRNAGSRVSR